MGISGRARVRAILRVRGRGAEDQIVSDTEQKRRPGNGRERLSAFAQIVLVLQGGGALGAYQAGVYEALHEAGVEPDWIIGTSIGAINAALIAGNETDNRLARLREFWRRVAIRAVPDLPSPWGRWFMPITDLTTLCAGIPGFFRLNSWTALGVHFPVGATRAGYFSTEPLEQTLSQLLDCAHFGRCAPRLTVGAANVATSEMRYFDSRDMDLSVRHIMASGALPPAFPPVRIGDEFYWDGGILSNTPTEAIFEDVPRRDSLVFAVHMWNPKGPVPATIWDVLHRQKDVQYSSRVAAHIARQRQVHGMRRVIAELVKRMPEQIRDTSDVQALAGYGCQTRMHFVRLLAPRLENEGHTKDIDFTPAGIAMRWRAGYEHARLALAQAPWEKPADPMEGVTLHEVMPEPGARLS
jgi:NTE family protein